MKSFRIPLLATLLLGASCAFPTSEAPLKKGMQHSNFAFGYWSTTYDSGSSETDVDTTMLEVSHGWFFRDDMEAGGRVSYQNSDTSPGGSDTLWAALAYYRYYFLGGGSIHPYGEAAVGLGNVDSGGTNDDLTIWSLGIGMLQMMSAYSGLDAILKYQSVDYDGPASETGFHVELGYSLFW